MSPETPPPPPFPHSPSPFPGGPPPAGAPKTSAAAVTSLILGILSLFCSCFTALPSLICGIVGLSNIGRSNGQLKGKGLAVAGMILAVVMSIANVGIFAAKFKEALATNPAFKEIYGTFMGMTQASMNATKLHAALSAHAAANGGKLPGSLEQIVSSGAIDASALNHPIEGTPGFWTLEQPGAVLKDLPARTVVLRSTPFTMNNESMEIVVFADGKVEPRQLSALPPSDGSTDGHGTQEGDATQDGNTPQEGEAADPTARENAAEAAPSAPGQ